MLKCFRREEAASPKRRELDDEELDSGDDVGRHDRLEDDGMDSYGNEDAEQGEMRSLNVADVRLARHPIPSPSDGEVIAQCGPRDLGNATERCTILLALSVSDVQATRR